MRRRQWKGVTEIGRAGKLPKTSAPRRTRRRKTRLDSRCFAGRPVAEQKGILTVRRLRARRRTGQTAPQKRSRTRQNPATASSVARFGSAEIHGLRFLLFSLNTAQAGMPVPLWPNCIRGTDIFRGEILRLAAPRLRSGQALAPFDFAQGRQDDYPRRIVKFGSNCRS